MATPFEPMTAQDAIAITKSDSTIYTPPLDAVYVGTAGTLTVKTAAGSTTAFECVAGAIIPVTCTQVRSTGTDAADIVGLRYR